MSTEVGEPAPCCARETPRPSMWRRPSTLGALGCTLAALAVPKCPMCVAGYLSLVGVGVGLGGAIGGALRPGLIALGVGAGLWTLAARVRASRASC